MVAHYTRNDMSGLPKDKNLRTGRIHVDKGKNVKPWKNAPKNFSVPSIGYPTDAPPGTIEKLLVMIAREERREKIFHTHDARHDGDVKPLLYYLAKYEEQQETRMITQEKSNDTQDI